MKLFTFGYGMKKKVSGRSALFRRCLEEAGVSLLLDTRDSPWGGFWNPKNIQSILDDSPVTYRFKEEDYHWHKVLGAAKRIRSHAVDDFELFRRLYLEDLENKDPDALQKLFNLLEEEGSVAIMCCEPFIPRADHSLERLPEWNCHRFILADEMVKRGFLSLEQIQHLDLDDLVQ